MRTRIYRALLVLLGLAAPAALTACGGSAPKLTLSEAYIADRSDAGTVLHVVVKAENPTAEPLAMWAIAYSGAADQGATGSISRWAQATAPPGGSVAFDLPIVITGATASTISISGKVAYVPGGRFRELLNELDVPLPTTTFSGSVPVDQSATPRVTAALRPGTVRTATVIDRGPVKAVDTLPPLKTN